MPCRTFVNIVSVPSVDKVVGLKPKPEQCRLMHHIECSCWEGRLYNQTDQLRRRLHNIQQEFIKAEAEVAQYDEFKGLQEFAVVYQPFSLNLSVSLVQYSPFFPFVILSTIQFEFYLFWPNR